MSALRMQVGSKAYCKTSRPTPVTQPSQGHPNLSRTTASVLGQTWNGASPLTSPGDLYSTPGPCGRVWLWFLSAELSPSWTDPRLPFNPPGLQLSLWFTGFQSSVGTRRLVRFLLVDRMKNHKHRDRRVFCLPFRPRHC